MQITNLSFIVILTLLSLWAIHNYDVNSRCYEIVKVGAPLNQDILLNKCSGLTWTLVHDKVTISEWEENDEGVMEEVLKSKETLVWTSIALSGGVITFNDKKE